MSVIVPFFGERAAALATMRALDRLALRHEDEVILADNTPDQVARSAMASDTLRPRPLRTVPAAEERTSYYARNVGAEHANAEWLLFLDADCGPSRSLLDDFFAEPVAADVGALAGEVAAGAAQESLVARYSHARGYLSQASYRRHPRRPFAVTANLLVRAAAWRQLGGFLEGVRSGGDGEFCWRLQEAGWRLDIRPGAVVEHRHRDSVPALARQAARYGAGSAWLNRRYARPLEPPRLRGATRAAAAAVRWTAAGQGERSRFRALDAVVQAAGWVGYLRSNAVARAAMPSRSGAAPRETRDRGLVVLVDGFPELSETFVVAETRALSESGFQVRIEAGARALRPDRRAAREFSIAYLEDEAAGAKLGDAVWLAARHPLRCAADLVARRRWRKDEDVVALRALAPAARRLARSGERHLHAHFAGPGALRALRLARILGLTYSVTAHAYDVWRDPRNLTEKLTRAAFATSGCDYNVRHLRAITGPRHADRIHKIVMGVDGERFRRATPYRGGGRVIAVGRLTPKKGFGHLIEAAALMRRDERLERVMIVGAGPLQDELATQIDRLGLGEKVVLAGALDHGHVREALEEADLLAMPCVVAPDGDRDSMPVVVKEALAMEIPVVASDEVGLPEVVWPQWGRLVPPGDPGALSSALGELLGLSVDRRVEMGRAGREHVLRECSVQREAAKLGGLIEDARGAAPLRGSATD